MQQYLVLLAADSSVFSPQSNFGHIHVPTIRPPSHFSISLKNFFSKSIRFSLPLDSSCFWIYQISRVTLELFLQ